MSFISPTPDELYSRTTAGPVAMDLPPDPSWGATALAPIQGAVGAVADLGRMLTSGPSAEQVARLKTAFPEMKSLDLQADPMHIQDGLKAVSDWAKVDPREAGTSGAVLGGVTRGLTLAGLGSLVGGPVGAAAMLGSTEAYTAYQDAIDQGFDEKTAGQLAGKAGVFNAAGAFLPMRFGSTLTKSLLGGSALNVGMGMADRYESARILQQHGYPEAAQQYRALDGMAMFADGVLGAAFGAFGHATRPVDPALIKKALDLNNEEHLIRSGMTLSTNPLESNLHDKLVDASVTDLLRGSAPSVSKADADTLTRPGAVVDPAHEALAQGALDSAATENPTIHDEIAPVEGEQLELPLTQQAETATAEQPTPPPQAPGIAETGTPQIDPISQTALDQMTQLHPDMPVRLDNGTEIPLSQLRQHFDEQMGLAKKLATLHDIAAACLMRTQ